MAVNLYDMKVGTLCIYTCTAVFNACIIIMYICTAVFNACITVFDITLM